MLREAQEEATTPAKRRRSLDGTPHRRGGSGGGSHPFGSDAAVEGLQADAQRALEAARADADRIRVEAEEAGGVEIEAAQEQRTEMVDEALLSAVAYSKTCPQAKGFPCPTQRLQAGRERLIDSYAIVQRTSTRPTKSFARH